MESSNGRTSGGSDGGASIISGAASDQTRQGSASVAEEASIGFAEELMTFFSSPLNLILTFVAAFLFYRILKPKANDDSDLPPPLPPPLPKRDVTLAELHKHNGKGEDGRVCLAVCGKVFDVTKGRRFYGPGGPYAPLAGNDATRSLATFAVDAVKEEWDDVSDLTPAEMSSAKEWELQFSERYDYVGRLVRTEAEIRDPGVEGEEESGEGEGSASSPLRAADKKEL